MITRLLMDQLLKSGSQTGRSKPVPGQTGGATSQLAGVLSGVGGGALASGAMSMLLGSKKGRRMGGKLLTYGGLGALGVVAYKAYSEWQKKNQGTVTQVEPRTVDRVPQAQAEDHSYAILRAVIGAAKADGHIDDRERELIDQEISRLSGDAELVSWFNQELHRPLDPADIARSAKTPEIAAEMYLASLLVIDEQNFMERSYLEELARQLKLDAGLIAELKAQADAQ